MRLQMSGISARNSQYILYGLYLQNIVEIRQFARAHGGNYPSVLAGLRSGIIQPRITGEEWQTYLRVCQTRSGDASDLATAVAAELTACRYQAFPISWPIHPHRVTFGVASRDFGLINLDPLGSTLQGPGPVRFSIGYLRPENAKYILKGLYLQNIVEIRDYAAMHGGYYPSVLAGIANGSVLYDRNDPGEDWQPYLKLMRRRRGDCEDLSCAVAAELTLLGDPSEPDAYKSGESLWHVYVESERQGPLDPSRAAGMGKENLAFGSDLYRNLMPQMEYR